MLERIRNYVEPQPSARARAEGMGLHIINKGSWVPDELRWKIAQFSPRSELGKIIQSCLDYLPAEQAAEIIDAISRTVVLESELRLTRILERNETHPYGPLEFDYGVVSRRTITSNGVDYLVDSWQASTTLSDMVYHGLGTSSGAESSTSTGLHAELGSTYSTANTREAGSSTEGASSNIWKTIATTVVSTSVTVKEHGIFNSATASTGIMWDRHLTGDQTLSSGDSLQATYNMTASAGG